MNELEKKIKDTIDGLFYISETDAHITFYNGDEKKINEIYEEAPIVTGKIKNVEIKESKLFFDKLTEKKEWHTDEQKKRRSRFEKLKKLLERGLNDLWLIRTGKVRIDIYVIGKNGEGKIAGIKTNAVET